MKRTSTICDRCGAACESGTSMVTVEATAGSIRQRLPGEAIDLCRDCGVRGLSVQAAA